MSNIDVSFVHPTHNGEASVTLDDTMPADDVIANLVEGGFLSEATESYGLLPKSGNLLRGDQSLRDGGIRNKDRVRVVPNTLAGATS